MIALNIDCYALCFLDFELHIGDLSVSACKDLSSLSLQKHTILLVLIKPHGSTFRLFPIFGYYRQC